MSDHDWNGVWEFDVAHSRIGFSARHAMVTKVRGEFRELSGRINVNAEHPEESTVEVHLQVASVHTRDPKRDEHLRSADFFDAEQWPEITFVSTRVEEVEEGSFLVTGDLTIRDVTKSVSIPVDLTGVSTDPFTGEARAGFEGTRRIDRRDYGLEWNMPMDKGGLLVSEKITMDYEISAVKAPADEQGEGQEQGEQPAEGQHEGE